jgi:regulator of protease activity HflC (stomatin/prohibitin superfamily)
MKRGSVIGLILSVGSVIGVIFLLFYSAFIIDQTQWAVLYHGGKINSAEVLPAGVHFKWPWIDRVVILDRRVNLYENKDNNKHYYMLWRVENFDVYLNKVGENTELLFSAVQAEIAKAESLQDIAKVLRANFGVDLMDLQIQAVKTELIPPSEEAQPAAILAEARAKALQIRQAGAEEVAAIYGELYRQDPAFYSFYQGLRLYQQLFNKNEVVVIIGADVSHGV